MPDTPSTKHGIERPADGDFIEGHPAVMRDAIDLIDELIAVAIDDDPRPAAATFGRFHRHPTTGVVSFDTGSQWVTIPVSGLIGAADLTSALAALVGVSQTG